MTDRAVRIERIRQLLEDRRHPERRAGILSATNLTRVALRFGAMAAAAAIVNRLLGSSGLAVLVALAAVAAADEGVASLWRRIGRRVQQLWTVLGMLAVGLIVVAMLVLSSSPAAKDAAGEEARAWCFELGAMDPSARSWPMAPTGAVSRARPDHVCLVVRACRNTDRGWEASRCRGLELRPRVAGPRGALHEGRAVG